MKKNVDPQKLKSVLHTILAEVNQEQSTKVVSILPTKPSLPISPNSKTKESFCSTMKHYGLSLTDRHLHEALLRDLLSLNKKHKNGYQKHLLSYDGVTRGFFNLVSIPKATDVDKIRQTAKDYKWIHNLLVALGGSDDKNDIQCTLYNLLTYLARSTYSQTWDMVVSENGYPIPKIDAYGTKAIQSMCNMNGSQMRTLRSCLRIEAGSPILSSEYAVNSTINSQYVEPVVNTYKYGSENIPYSYRSVKQCLELWLQDHTKANVKKNLPFDEVNVCINLDHGKGHSRVSANFIGRSKDKDGKWVSESSSFALGNARCKKDNATIIQNTFGKLLDDDLMLMKDKSIKICPSSGVTFVTQQQPTQQQQQEQQQEVQDAMNNNLPAGGCDDNQEKAVDIPLVFFLQQIFCCMQSRLVKKAVLGGGARTVIL